MVTVTQLLLQTNLPTTAHYPHQEQSQNDTQKNRHHFRCQIKDSLFSRIETNAKKLALGANTFYGYAYSTDFDWE